MPKMTAEAHDEYVLQRQQKMLEKLTRAWAQLPALVVDAQPAPDIPRDTDDRPRCKRFHLSGLIYEASQREYRRSRAVLVRYKTI